MSTISALLSIIFSSIWTVALYYDVNYIPRLGSAWWIYKLIMLTNINFVLCTIYSTVLVLSYPFPRVFRKFIDFTYYTCIFPVAIITSLLFWGLYAIEPELVMPAWIAELIPSWLNHVTHTFPLFFVLADGFLHQKSPPNNRTLLTFSAIHVFIYFSIIFAVRYFEGFWLYPLLTFFSEHHFILAYLAGLFGFFVLTKLAIGWNKFCWRNVTKKSKKT